MPYIIETFEPGGCLDPIGSLQEPDRTRAVATLDDPNDDVETARSVARGIVRGRYPEWWAYREAVDALDTITELPETGGTIGPLPDGTVIAVEQISESALYNAIRPSLCCPTCGIQQRYVSGSDLIDAYNEANA